MIVATGASARWLEIPGEERLRGRGVSSCATCDGAFFRDKHIVVVGGGDSALEEALFLTRFGSRVTIVHRRDRLRASKIMADRAHSHAKINFIWNAVVEAVLGETHVTGLRLRDVVENRTFEIEADAIFVAIGHTPNTAVFGGRLDLDELGYIASPDVPRRTSKGSSSPATCRTSLPPGDHGGRCGLPRGDGRREYLEAIEFREDSLAHR